MIISVDTKYFEYAWEVLGFLDEKSGRILVLLVCCRSIWHACKGHTEYMVKFRAFCTIFFKSWKALFTFDPKTEQNIAILKKEINELKKLKKLKKPLEI